MDTFLILLGWSILLFTLFIIGGVTYLVRRALREGAAVEEETEYEPDWQTGDPPAPGRYLVTRTDGLVCTATFSTVGRYDVRAWAPLPKGYEP